MTDKRFFTVEISEIWKRALTVEASTKEEAILKANQAIEAGNDDGDFEYSHTLDTDEWYVQDITNQIKEG